jgi:hypothetical protein
MSVLATVNLQKGRKGIPWALMAACFIHAVTPRACTGINNLYLAGKIPSCELKVKSLKPGVVQLLHRSSGKRALQCLCNACANDKNVAKLDFGSTPQNAHGQS